MLGGERPTLPITNYTDVPTTGETAALSFLKPFAQVEQLGNYIFPGASTDETIKQSSNRIAMMDEVINTPGQGIGQKSLNFVSGMAGSLIPTLPLAIAGGAVGGAIAGAVGFGARGIAAGALAGEASEGVATAYLASQAPLSSLAEGALSHYLPSASLAEIGEGLASAYTSYKAFTIPEHFSNNYDSVNNALDTSHAIEDWGSDNYGFLFGAAPFAAGYVAFKGIRGIMAQRAAGRTAKELDAELARLLKNHEEVLQVNKVKEGETAKKQAVVSELQDHLQQAEDEGHISPEMHEWYLDYLENPNHPDTHKSALNVLSQLQVPYDRVTGRVWSEVLTKESVKDFQGALFDQGITQFSEQDRQLLSSYIIHNQLDAYIGAMRDNPNLLMAMKGMTHSVGLKIEAQAAAIASMESSMARKFSKGLGRKEVFSQQSLYDHLKKIGAYSRVHIPYEVPTNVMNKLYLERKIRKILSRETLEDERLYNEGVHHELKDELRGMKLKSPMHELKGIKNDLFSNGELVNGYKNKRAYHRLVDLSQVWPNARVLLDTIHMKAMNTKQQGLNDALKNFVEMADSKVARFADPESVKRYLNQRIDQAVPQAKELKKFDFSKAANEEVEVMKAVEKEDTLTNVGNDEEALREINNSNLEFAKENFELSESRVKQLYENQNAFADLINCALG
jgi:hypothetical protein